MEGRFFLLIGVGDQASHEIDEEVGDTPVAGVLDLGDVLELVVDRFDVTVANSKIDPAPSSGRGVPCHT